MFPEARSPSDNELEALPLFAHDDDGAHFTLLQERAAGRQHRGAAPAGVVCPSPVQVLLFCCLVGLAFIAGRYSSAADPAATVITQRQAFNRTVSSHTLATPPATTMTAPALAASLPACIPAPLVCEGRIRPFNMTPFSLPFNPREVSLVEEQELWPLAKVPERYAALAQRARVPQLFGVPAPYCQEWTALDNTVTQQQAPPPLPSHSNRSTVGLALRPISSATLPFPCIHPSGSKVAHIVATVVTFCGRQNVTIPRIRDGWGSWLQHIYYASATPQLGLINLHVPHSDRWARSSMEEMHALKSLVDLHPGAPWYMKSDDDAWVHVPRVVRMLARFDPDQPWYIGNQLRFATHKIPGSEQIIQQLSYCAGGTGYYLSRAAMALIYPHLLSPILSCCSDVQVGWLTHEYGGFGCTNVPGIVGGPIDDINKPAISYHYVTPPQQTFLNEHRYPIDKMRETEFKRTDMTIKHVQTTTPVYSTLRQWVSAELAVAFPLPVPRTRVPVAASVQSQMLGHLASLAVSRDAVLSVYVSSEYRAFGYILRRSYRLTAPRWVPPKGFDCPRPRDGTCSFMDARSAARACDGIAACRGFTCERGVGDCRLYVGPLHHEFTHSFESYYRNSTDVVLADLPTLLSLDLSARAMTPGALAASDFNFSAPCSALHKCVFAFALYGNNPRYTNGTMENLRLAARLFPQWACRVYHDDTVTPTVLAQLRRLGAELSPVHASGATGGGMFWRFSIASDPTVHRFVIADGDSRLHARQQAAIAEWMDSGFSIHIMRDHPAHARPINGGMWGGVRGALSGMSRLIANWSAVPESGYGADQDFLGLRVWPLVEFDQMAHDSYSCERFRNSRGFPTPRPDNFMHVGQVVRTHTTQHTHTTHKNTQTSSDTRTSMHR